MQLWNTPPGRCEEEPQITYYPPAQPVGNGAVVIFPGGGYAFRCTEYEGEWYAKFLNDAGIHAFVVDYRVTPHVFPLPLLDARHAVRYVRAHAAEYGIDPEKIAVMGSSAGGHLAALSSTYTAPLEMEEQDELREVDCRPNAQILCYPVILPPDSPYCHVPSYENLLGKDSVDTAGEVSPVDLVGADTPPAFLWHTAADEGVPVENSLLYAAALRRAGVPVELHIFPYGHHGLNVAAQEPHASQWCPLLVNWLKLNEWTAK